MKYSKFKLSLACLPFLLSLIGLFLSIYFCAFLDNYLSVAFIPLVIIFFVLLCMSLRPIFRMVNRIKIIKYVSYKIKPIEEFALYLKESESYEECFMNNGSYTKPFNKAITALSELGLNADELADELYNDPFLVEDIVKSLKGLLEDTAKPFGNIPYQFYNLVR